jgi:hypothetical protein
MTVRTVGRAAGDDNGGGDTDCARILVDAPSEGETTKVSWSHDTRVSMAVKEGRCVYLPLLGVKFGGVRTVGPEFV